MSRFLITLLTKRDGPLHFDANGNGDALSALEAFMDDLVLDADTYVESITVQERLPNETL